MGAITIEFDNTLQQSEIITPLLSSSKAEGGDNYTNEYTDKAQTSVFGIKVPLIMINSTVIDFNAVKYFSLKTESILPELTLTVEDRYELINNIDKPTNDNEVRIQILPQFDDTYKKINLTFNISNINVTGSMIRLICIYKLPELVKSRFESFGKIDTYSLFKNIATTTKLGFASNIAGSTDKRFVYCDNKSYLDILNDEIQFSDTTSGILDYWVDLWNNINIVDIKERYNAIDSQEDMQIWVSGQTREITADVHPVPIKIDATIDNHPAHEAAEFFVKNYSIQNNPGLNISKGSDRVYAIYEENKDEYLDYLIQDGDVKSDIYTKYDYLGENYGDYNYLLSKTVRAGFLQKINTNQIKVTLRAPLLGLMRGHKVNFVRYVNDDKIESKMKALEKAGVLNRDVESNIPLEVYEMKDDSTNGKFRVDRTVSGQYLIHAINIIYTNNDWDYVLTLVRPTSSIPKITKED